jgi:hypothetical protein
MENIQTNKNVAFYIKNFYKRNSIYFDLGLNNKKLNFLLKKKASC